MQTLTKALLAASFCLIASVPVYAGHGHRQDENHGYSHARLYDRMLRQYDRIEDGIESRELTRKEAKTLRRQQRQIRQLAREFRGDGWLSKKERRILKRKLDKSSQQIREFKHNDLNRYVALHERYGKCCNHAFENSGLNSGKDKRRHTQRSW